jgi:hypothetical protein
LEQQYQILAGNPGWGTLPPLDHPAKSAQNAAANTAAGSGGATGDLTSGSNANVAGTGGSSPANALQNQSSQEWYIEASRIEEVRVSSAVEVLAGDSVPWPRTPLTPPGTPANLVGREVMFSNHMPGNFVVPGFVN